MFPWKTFLYAHNNPRMHLQRLMLPEEQSPTNAISYSIMCISRARFMFWWESEGCRLFDAPHKGKKNANTCWVENIYLFKMKKEITTKEACRSRFVFFPRFLIKCIRNAFRRRYPDCNLISLPHLEHFTNNNNSQKSRKSRSMKLKLLQLYGKSTSASLTDILSE